MREAAVPGKQREKRSSAADEKQRFTMRSHSEAGRDESGHYEPDQKSRKKFHFGVIL